MAVFSAPHKPEIRPATSPRSGIARSCLTDSLGAGSFADLNAFTGVTFSRRRVKRGEVVFRSGDSTEEMYAVRSGFFKTTNADDSGREQVVGFFMRGELFGLDGFSSNTHTGTATALEDSEIVVLPFRLLQDLARENQAMQRQLDQILSLEITRYHGMLLLLGSMRAETRLASFLVNLSVRFARQGYSPSDFILRMTRKEIGSYLGLSLETVSRLFSEFKRRGFLITDKKHICIHDPKALQRVLSES